MKQSVLDARTLACYIKKYYKEKFGKDNISPIKLQKALYFCFAYWGGFVRQMNTRKSELADIKEDYIELLFPNSIEAWVYGPVIPDVYHEKDLDSYDKDLENPFNNEITKDFIDGVLDDVLASNDFKLVEVSHEDKCWKRNFKPESRFHNCVIPPEEIIREYAKLY